MAYTDKNYKTKKALKDDVAAGVKVTVRPNPFRSPHINGTIYLEGPHYPEPHKWYAQATLKDGLVIKVK